MECGTACLYPAICREMEEELERAQEEIRHLAAKLRCLEEEKAAMLAAFAKEKRAIIDDMEEVTRERVRRLEIEIERREREIDYLQADRKELTQEVGRLHMENHRTTEEFARLHSEIYRLQAAAGEALSVQTAQHVGPATPHRRGEDHIVATCARPESPVRMARIVPHDKKKSASEVYTELEAAPPPRKKGGL